MALHYGMKKIQDKDIITAKVKQAALKETFVFPAALTSKRLMKSDIKRVSAGLRV